MIIFFLFSKIFLKNCSVSFFFKKKKLLQTNLLKAPSRHKKFFHQICYELFFFKIIFNFCYYINIPLQYINDFFSTINIVFIKFGTNLLTRVKFLTIFNSKPIFLNFF